MNTRDFDQSGKETASSEAAEPPAPPKEGRSCWLTPPTKPGLEELVSLHYSQLQKKKKERLREHLLIHLSGFVQGSLYLILGDERPFGQGFLSKATSTKKLVEM